jgi:hypothetical protein
LAAIGDRESCMLPPHQGASAMSHYRAYLIAPDGGHIKAVDIECIDDDAAKKRAAQMANGSNVELWEHARRIAKFDSRSGY